ncbi:MAG: hypothetical protein JOY78_01315 [Pseudonocardia sp.]|nr:hypothetical protein [Pseudonocardia sp.]
MRTDPISWFPSTSAIALFCGVAVGAENGTRPLASELAAQVGAGRDSGGCAAAVSGGLVRPSFVPPPPIRRLRDLTRYRTAIVQELTREIQRLEKVLEDAGIKLSTVASHTLSKSSRAMIEALIGGERDPHVLADLALARMRRKIPQLREALLGRFTDHHAFICASMLERIDTADDSINKLTERIEQEIAPWQETVTG